MKSEKLFRAIGNISDGKIIEADNTVFNSKPLKPIWVRWVSVAAAACLIVALSLYTLPKLTQPPEVPSKDTPTSWGEMSAIIPRWNEKTITQQFYEVDWNDINYSVSNPDGVDLSAVGEHLGTVAAAGYDVYEDKDYTINCELYVLKSISTACAIAVKYEGYDGFYPFAASLDYRPVTLGEFIDDLNLRENLEFNNLIYSNERIYNADGYYVTMIYTLPDPSVIWDLLLDDTTVENVHDDSHMFLASMNISIDVNVIGSRNISIAVNDEGYLQTNILSTGKTFFIGKEKVQAFIDFVVTYGECTVREDSRTFDTKSNDDSVQPEQNSGIAASAPPQETPAVSP